MASSKLCSVAGCGKPVHGRELCNSHYARWRKWGDPLIAKKTNHGAHLAFLEAHKDYKEGDCLMWPFAKCKDGYGKTTFNGKNMIPARAMCILAHGKPSIGMEVAHECGKGSSGCVNPGHLSWKTHRDNLADMQRHGTIMRGESHYAAKFSETDVRQIRALAAQGVARKTIAEMFRVHKESVRYIILRKRWGWLE